MAPCTGDHQLDMGRHTHNRFKGVQVHEVLRFVAKLRVHHSIKIQEENLYCGNGPAVWIGREHGDASDWQHP